MTKRKVLSERELKEREFKRMMRNPRTNPESAYNRKHLVTGHIGGRTFILYHGNNINKAAHIAWARTFAEKRKKGPKVFCKVWNHDESHVQILEP